MKIIITLLHIRSWKRIVWERFKICIGSHFKRLYVNMKVGLSGHSANWCGVANFIFNNYLWKWSLGKPVFTTKSFYFLLELFPMGYCVLSKILINIIVLQLRLLLFLVLKPFYCMVLENDSSEATFIFTWDVISMGTTDFNVQ